MSGSSNFERRPIPPAREVREAREARDARMVNGEPRGGLTFRQVVLITAIFVVVTLLVMRSLINGLGSVEGVKGDAKAVTRDAPGPADGSEQNGSNGAGEHGNGSYDDLKLGELPPGGKYTTKGSGKFRTVGEPGKSFGEGKKKFTYVVEVETTLKASAYGGDDAFAAMVDATLSNPKSWGGDPRFSFQHVDEKKLKNGEEPDLRIQLTSTETTAKTCGDTYGIETSCNYPGERRVVLNEARWVRGAIPFEGDLGAYRQYMINHEVGHGVGHKAHKSCTRDGGLAPVMMQQTISLNNAEIYKINPEEPFGHDSKTCRANPWVFPYGPKDS